MARIREAELLFRRGLTKSGRTLASRYPELEDGDGHHFKKLEMSRLGCQESHVRFGAFKLVSTRNRYYNFKGTL